MKTATRLLAISFAMLLLSANRGASADPLFYGPTTYLSAADSPFAGGSYDYFHLEDFENGLSAPGVSYSGGVIVNPSPYTDSVDGDDGSVNGDGSGGHSYYTNLASNLLTFVFDETVLGSLPTVVGIVWTDVWGVDGGLNGSGPVSFTAFDKNGLSLGSVGPSVLGDNTPFSNVAEDRFFGVSFSGGIGSIAISMPSSTDWEVDHLQYGASTSEVPEPASAILLTLGTLGMAYVRKRKFS